MCFGKKERVGAQFPNVEQPLVPTTRKDAIMQQPTTSPLPERPYTYDRIEDGFIRLLQIRPAADQNAPLRATLVHEKLVETGESQGPTYEALSYCWGANIFSQKLYFPTGVLNITKDLASALIRLRRIDAERTLWVDQCCINQKDGGEKELQVSMMDQIYKNAASTIIWLGEETAHTHQALDVIQIAADRYGFQSTMEGYDKFWWPNIPILKDDNEEAQMSLKSMKEKKVREIYDRPWFTRIWIVQEVILAKNPVIQIGSFELAWRSFINATAFFRAAQLSPRAPIDNDFLELVERAGTLIDIRWQWGVINEDQPTMILENYQHWGIYMSKLRKQSCTNDLDRVYGMLGLRTYAMDITKKQDHRSLVDITVDYKKEPFQLFQEWALSMTETGTLSFLVDAGVCHRDVVIKQGSRIFHNQDPKWRKGCVYYEDEVDGDGVGSAEVIRTRTTSDKTSARMRIDPSLQELPSWVPELGNKSKKLITMPWTNTFGHGTFCARNKEFHTMIQSVLYDEKIAPGTLSVKAVLLDQLKVCFAQHEWDDSQPCTREDYLRSLQQTRRMVFDQYTKYIWPLEEERNDAFIRTTFADGCSTRCQTVAFQGNFHRLEGPYVPISILREIYRTFENPGTAARGAKIPVRVIQEILSEIHEGAVFFITEKRYIGLAPLIAKENDVVALIDSVRVPMLLRPSKTPDGSKEGFMVLGPCYVHGVMYGETSNTKAEYIALI